LADSFADIEARDPRFQIGVFVAPGMMTSTRMLLGGSVGAALLKVALKGEWGSRISTAPR
jgi:hypothetical protein